MLSTRNVPPNGATNYCMKAIFVPTISITQAKLLCISTAFNLVSDVATENRTEKIIRWIVWRVAEEVPN